MRRAWAVSLRGRNGSTGRRHRNREHQNVYLITPRWSSRAATRTECILHPLPLPTAIGQIGTLQDLGPRSHCRQFGAIYLPSAGSSRVRAVPDHAESKQRLNSVGPLNACFHIEAVNWLLSILTSRPE